MATHSNIVAWKIPWTEEPGGLQFMGLQRIGHDWFNACAQRRDWYPSIIEIYDSSSKLTKTYVSKIIYFKNFKEFVFCIFEKKFWVREWREMLQFSKYYLQLKEEEEEEDKQLIIAVYFLKIDPNLWKSLRNRKYSLNNISKFLLPLFFKCQNFHVFVFYLCNFILLNIAVIGRTGCYLHEGNQ